MPGQLDESERARGRRALMRRDPQLGAVIRTVGDCDLAPRGDPYRMLLRSVIYQQLAGAAARAIDGRLRSHWRGRYPRPEVMLEVPISRLRSVGLSRQKIAAVRAVAEAFASGAVSSRALHRMEDAQVIEAVTRIRGIGEWTAHMLLMFSLGRPDVLPVGDFGVRKGAMQLYGLREMPKAAELETIAEPWRPWRSIASWYLWRVVDTRTPGAR